MIRRELRKAKNVKVVGHGDCDGADKQGGCVADNMGIRVKSYPAQWTLLGLAAGPIRNRKMLHVFKPDFVLAFHRNIEKSKGTKDMVKAATEAGLTPVIIPY